MNAFAHQVLSGLATGGIYASIALALVMIFQTTQIVNFAQGEMAMFTTYLSWMMINVGFPYWVAFVATVTIAFLIGLSIERLVIRPLKSAPVINVVIVTIGVFVIFNSVAGLLFGYDVKAFPSPFSFGSHTNTYVSASETGAFVVTLIMLAVVFAFFRFTTFGLAMRAAAQNPGSSRLVGIRVGRMLALGWGLAAALGAVAGMMAAPIVFLDPNMMGGILIYSFAGALLGGITNPWGAAVGGFIVGVLENLVGAYVVGTELKLTMALVIIMIVVTLKPAGLFGRVTVQRV